MKKIVLFALIGIILMSCGGSSKIETNSQLATVGYKTDSFFMLKLSDNELWKITDVSLLKTWSSFPVILVSGDDSSQILRGKFYVYNTTFWRSRYYDHYYNYLTNGLENLEFESNVNNLKIGDSFYVFYHKRACFKPKKIN
jgi:hypothetical protein